MAVFPIAAACSARRAVILTLTRAREWSIACCDATESRSLLFLAFLTNQFDPFATKISFIFPHFKPRLPILRGRFGRVERDRDRFELCFLRQSVADHSSSLLTSAQFFGTTACFVTHVQRYQTIDLHAFLENILFHLASNMPFSLHSSAKQKQFWRGIRQGSYTSCQRAINHRKKLPTPRYDLGRLVGVSAGRHREKSNGARAVKRRGLRKFVAFWESVLYFFSF